VRRWRREGEFGGLDERQKWFKERWEERWRAGCVIVVGLWSRTYAIDSHGVITGVILRIVVDGAVLEDLILIINSNLQIRIWQCRAHASQYLKGELHRPQLRLDALEAKFGLRFVIWFWVVLRIPLIGIGLVGLFSVTVSQVEWKSGRDVPAGLELTPEQTPWLLAGKPKRRPGRA
jgi:hypothetical protein